MLTLVRDTYRASNDVGELLGLRDAAGQPAPSEDIIDHLLDRVLPAAYTQQPGESPPRYDLPAAERALRRIATRMNEEGTRDLQWWHVPAWSHAAPRVIANWLGTILAVGLLTGLVPGLVTGSLAAAQAGIAVALVAGLVAGLAFGRGKRLPKRIAAVRWRYLFRPRPVMMGLITGLAIGYMAGGIFSLTGHGPVAGSVAGLGAGLLAWLGTGVVAGISRPGTDSTSPLSPLSSWRGDRRFGLVSGLTTGLGIGLLFLVYGIVLGGVLMAGQWGGLEIGLVAWLVSGLALGLLIGLVHPQSWSSSLAFAQLAVSDRTPLRLMRFLEDARSRGVLRTVGPVYQFRHARLQDRLATHKPAAGQGGSGGIRCCRRPVERKPTVSDSPMTQRRLGMLAWMMAWFGLVAGQLYALSRFAKRPRPAPNCGLRKRAAAAGCRRSETPGPAQPTAGGVPLARRAAPRHCSGPEPARPGRARPHCSRSPGRRSAAAPPAPGPAAPPDPHRARPARHAQASVQDHLA